MPISFSILLFIIFIHKTFQINQSASEIGISYLIETNELGRHLLWTPKDFGINSERDNDFLMRLLVLGENEFSFESNEEGTITEATESTNGNEEELIINEENSNTENIEGDGGAADIIETGGVYGGTTVSIEAVITGDCVPLTVEVYEDQEQIIPTQEDFVCWEEEDYRACAGGISIVLLNCETTTTCESVYVPRHGFQCLCRIETRCVEIY